MTADAHLRLQRSNINSKRCEFDGLLQYLREHLLNAT